MKKFSKERLLRLKEQAKKDTYIQLDWVTESDDIFTLEEYTEYIDPMFKHFVSAEVISKPSKDGGTFFTVKITMDGIANRTMGLSKVKDNRKYFEEGDLIEDPRFCYETCESEGKSHWYITDAQYIEEEED